MPLRRAGGYPMESLEPRLTLVRCRLTTGTTGAVSAVSGKGFATNGTPVGELGGVVRDAEAAYTITLPGRGGLQDIVPLAACVHGATGAARWVVWTDVDLDDRTVSVSFQAEAVGGPEDEELPNAAAVDFTFLVRETSAT